MSDPESSDPRRTDRSATAASRPTTDSARSTSESSVTDSSSDASSPTESSGPGGTFDERLTVPWWWWPAAAVVVFVVGHEIELSAHRSAWGYLGYVGAAVVCGLVLWSMGRTRIQVTADGELHAGKAKLPRSVIGRGATVAASAKSAALGRQLDPAAFLVHHGWVKTMVLLVLDDPDDPTPYWLVSTRRPGELLRALGIPDATAESR